MKRLLAFCCVLLIAAGLAGCGKRARLRTPTDERARQERESAEERLEDFSDERYEERSEGDPEPPDGP